jgi:hypothetical protein
MEDIFLMFVNLGHSFNKFQIYVIRFHTLKEVSMKVLCHDFNLFKHTFFFLESLRKFCEQGTAIS